MPTSHHSDGASPLRVLLVEDEPSIAITLRDDLAEHGYQVTLERDGHAARERLCEQRFDAAISDWRLPGASGLDVLHDARRHAPDMPLLLMTAHTTRRCGDQLHALGAALLVKPFANGAVVAWLRRHAGR
ncbi:MAG: response regulator transcription factor [Planctomycetota bacterium]